MNAIERLRELEAAATTAPWRVAGPTTDEDYPWTVLACEYQPDGALIEWAAPAEAMIETDADLIAAMRNALPALLDVAEAARNYMDRPAPRHTWDPAHGLRAALARLVETLS